MEIQTDGLTSYSIYPKKGIFPPFTPFQIFKVICVVAFLTFWAFLFSDEGTANKIFWSIVFIGFYFTALTWIHHLSEGIVVMVPEVAIVPGTLGSFFAIFVWIAITSIIFLTGIAQWLGVTMLFEKMAK